MWKRMSFAGFAGLLLCVSQSAAAQIVAFDSHGCAALEELVYREVSLSGLGTPFSRPQLPSGEGYDLICNQTAKAASEGFTKAMATINVFVTWPTPEEQRGDYCLSHNIEQCYPGRNPYAPYTSAESKLVADAWWSVQRALRGSMPLGSAGDVSRFTQSELSLRVASELNRVTRGSWEVYRE